MRIGIKVLLMVKLFALISFVNLAQSNCMLDTLSNETSKKIYKIISDYVDDGDLKKTIPYLYWVNRGLNKSEMYLGLISNKEQLKIKPSYVLYTLKGNLIFVFTGIEDKLIFSDEYKRSIEKIADERLESEGWRINVHYFVWYFKIQKGKVSNYTERLPKKKHNNIPYWIRGS